MDIAGRLPGLSIIYTVAEPEFRFCLTYPFGPVAKDMKVPARS